MLTYRNLLENEICRQLFLHFTRHQIVTKCWRKRNGQWTVENAPFIDEWTEADYEELILDLQETVQDVYKRQSLPGAGRPVLLLLSVV